jgi:hypothetical protein
MTALHTGFMVNHAEAGVYDVSVEAARAGGFVILPVGCATAITDESQRAHLPEGFDEDVVLVRSGADLLRAVAAG